MNDRCSDCGKKIKPGAWYWYKKTARWDTGEETTEILCMKCIRNHVDGTFGSYGWRLAYNGTAEKDDTLPPFHKPCIIRTKDGQEHPARLIKLNPQYHQHVKEHRVWRREDAEKRSERYIELGDVIAWRRENEK